jgi:hypothetical protein
VGGRAGLLPFSNDKLTANHNQKAVDAYNKGDMDKALFHINASLQLHPDQPEMIRLREKIAGEKARINEKSLMDRVLHKEIMQTPDVVRGSQPRKTAYYAPSQDSAPEASIAHSAPAPSVVRDFSSDQSPAQSDEQSDQAMWDDQQTIWQSRMSAHASALPSSSNSLSEMSPAQQRFYNNYLNGLFTSLGMADIASCFEPETGDAVVNADETDSEHAPE